MFKTILGTIIEKMADEGSLPNVPTSTMGGEVWWNDLAECNGWRLQQNTLTQHARILDPDDVRRAWGSLSAMKQQFPMLAGTDRRKEYII
ncbi:MAG: hypothetical protein ACI4WS_06320 [Oscillospiraceae bacterium]